MQADLQNRCFIGLNLFFFFLVITLLKPIHLHCSVLVLYFQMLTMASKTPTCRVSMRWYFVKFVSCLFCWCFQNSAAIFSTCFSVLMIAYNVHSDYDANAVSCTGGFSKLFLFSMVGDYSGRCVCFGRHSSIFLDDAWKSVFLFWYFAWYSLRRWTAEWRL